MQRSKSIRPKSPRLLDREINRALAGRGQAHAARAQPTDDRLPWKGQRVRIDPSPRTIKPFELDRPYVVRHKGRLYTIVSDVWSGNVAHPAEVEGKARGARRGRSSHATKKSGERDKTSDKITIDQLAKMFGLPDWESVDERNQHHYWEMARGADDEEAQQEAEMAAQEEVYNQWYDAVEAAADKLFEEHGLELKPTGKQGTPTRRYEFKITPANSWNDAGDKIRETINGVGDFHFGSLREFLDSGPYTARQAVLSHLGYIKKHPYVYGGLGANQLYEMHWR